jgi:hypothetical protein
MIIGVVLGVGLVVGGIVCLAGFISKCQKCGKWFSKSTVRKDKVKEE